MYQCTNPAKAGQVVPMYNFNQLSFFSLAH
jgi:hypothetical protein